MHVNLSSRHRGRLPSISVKFSLESRDSSFAVDERRYVLAGIAELLHVTFTSDL